MPIYESGNATSAATFDADRLALNDVRKITELRCGRIE
jgi:hypothetical protein